MFFTWICWKQSQNDHLAENKLVGLCGEYNPIMLSNTSDQPYAKEHWYSTILQCHECIGFTVFTQEVPVKGTSHVFYYNTTCRKAAEPGMKMWPSITDINLTTVFSGLQYWCTKFLHVAVENFLTIGTGTSLFDTMFEGCLGFNHYCNSAA